MTDEQAFMAWAPEDSPWSRWAKPVLFAHYYSAADTPSPSENPGPLSCVPTAAQRTAVVLDLPGAASVAAGLALASRGYRPVPLFNALPLPAQNPAGDPALSSLNYAVVDVLPIIAALRDGASQLRSLTLPAEAPPVFLLDANRQGSISGPLQSRFDNRSVCFTTDFPSANFLLAHGISGILLIQQTHFQPQPDLLHILCRWQDGGLPLALATPESAGHEPLHVRPPRWYKSMFQRALAALPLMHNRSGGFGAWMHDSPTAG
jgi:hypothetical protein